MAKPFFSEKAGGHSCKVYHLDAKSFLDSVPAGTADIVFLDPPFNIGKQYELAEFKDRDDPDVYFGWLSSILRQSVRILRPGGALYVYHLPAVAYKIASLLDHNLEFRHWIAVSMKNNFARGNRLYPAHYALLYFTKGSPSHFERPKIRPKTCRHCGKLVKDYGGYRKIIEEKGLNLSDFWDDLSPVRHASTKSRIANELPEALFTRILTISGFPGGTYVDPFLGSGGGVIAAAKAHMHSIAGDASLASCKLAATRIGGIQSE